MNGGLAVFKGEELWQSISNLGTIAAIGVGDVMNCGSNAVIIITIDGHCYVYLCLNNAGEKLRLVHKQLVPANTKGLAIGDVLGDGQTYMVLGFTDRIICLYKWIQNPTEASLVCLNKSECTSQIGSVCLGKDALGKNIIYVAQPGQNYLTMEFSDKEKALVEYHMVNTIKSKDSSISSQVLASVGKNGTTVLTLLDGTVLYVEGDTDIKWTVELEQQTFKSAKVNVSPDGAEQVAAAAWSGHTFIIDTEGHVVLFELGVPILGFTAGIYGPRGTTALVYVTFDNKIIICYDVLIENFVLQSPYAFQSQDPQLANYSRKELKKLTQYLLYDYPKRH
ncbi:hypothetical protein GE061_009852 [Apolygus lucorum]|uniref:Integrin-alpha FG-GAP repeat-containing protein 2 n=1 Tax=Apolygus lucorum TaxID=248454 RepID=A0A6A4K3G1_APOLU|nr:hypothetical protein GE061_009852 [Apolygus lucorum]